VCGNAKSDIQLASFAIRRTRAIRSEGFAVTGTFGLTAPSTNRRWIMFGLTELGVFHTGISLVALASGIVSFVRDRKIVPGTVVGKVYIVTTFETCLTGFGIFEHGGFGKPHVLGVIILVTLALAAWITRSKLPPRVSAGIQTVAYSATFLFHLIPGITETTTRLPRGASLFANADAAGLQTIIGVMAIMFVIVASVQVICLNKRGLAQITPV
jgi:uncharacterized membrane protein